MPSSNSEARVRAALLALISTSAWACATASYQDAPPDSLLSQSNNGGRVDAGNAGSSAIAGRSGVAGAAGSGASGAAQGGSSSGGSGSSAGRGGSNSGGTGSGGTGNAAGKGGSNSGGSTNAGSAGKGGSSSAGTGSGGMHSAGSSSAGSNSAGMSSGGSGSGTICDAAHSVATVATSTTYTGKANDCVRLAVDPSWSVINVQLQPLPGTQGYPVPFSFFNCGGNGTGSLTTDYTNVTLKSGANPGCDFFVQFGGGETTIKVTYYD